MGRILIYTTTGCTHCMRAKKLLEAKDVIYEEVNIMTFPARRQEMIMAAGGRKTVPQIFFNYEHIGGADDLFALENTGSLDAKIELCLNEHSELQISEQADTFTCDTNTETREISEFLELFGRIFYSLPRTKRTWQKAKTFKAKELISWLTINNNSTLEDAISICQRLQDETYICKQKNNSLPFPNDSTLYSFQEELQTNVLNSQRVFTGTARAATTIARELQRKMMEISDAFISNDGRGVDYAACAQSKIYREYKHVAVELQKADLSSLAGSEAMAFWINLYNAMIIHANIQVGPPSNFLQRSRFFGSLAYVIGGYKYTLSTIEHGILRGNRKPPNSFSRLLKKNDGRYQFVLKTFDARIHFALVCGAKSCPPIRIYDPDNLEQALQWATEGFCSEEVVLNPIKRSITLSMLFKWYNKDFGRSTKNILGWIVQFLPEDDKKMLYAIINSGKFKVKYATYNWDTNNRYGVDEERAILRSESPSSNDETFNNDEVSFDKFDDSELESIGDLANLGSLLTESSGMSAKMVDGRGKRRKLKRQQWEIDFSELELLEKIGQGGFGEVYRGHWKGQEVAIKKLLHEKLDDSEYEEFLKEISMMSKLQHKHVVQFKGAALQEPNACLVTEFVSQGSLHDVLRANKNLSLRRKLQFCMGAAKGMLYLHTLQPPVVHRDLKSLNLLVDENWLVKVADFGLSKAIPENKTTQINTKIGTLNWLAPEVLAETAPYTKAADVFSFGMVMYEIFTSKTPFEGKSALQVVRALDTGKRPELPISLPPKLIKLVEGCWAQNHLARPTFEEIILQVNCLLQLTHPDAV